MNDYVALGDTELCKRLRQALSQQGLSSADPGELEIQDEFDCRRWFSRNRPKGTFICLGLNGPLSVNDFMLTVAGTLNVIRAAMGNSERLQLLTLFPSNEYYLFSRLVHLLEKEKQLDFYCLSPDVNERPDVFANRCVLLMRDVSAKEAHQKSTQGPHQRREVRGQVLPQSEGGEQHRSSAQPVLEVPVAPAQGAAPGDVCAERLAPEGQEASDSSNHNAGAVPGVVPANQVS